MAKPYLSVIIPAYNEAKRLPLTLVDIDKHLSQQEFSYEVIVVSDGSTDATTEITKRFQPLVENLKLIEIKENGGKGAAVRQGMLAAKGNWRLFMDADNSTSIIEFNKMVPHIEDGFEIIIGSRAVKGAKMNPPQSLIKRFAGRFGNYFIRLILLKGIKDTQCGFKCFSEEASKKVFPLLQINRWAFDIESLALARSIGYQIKEMPVHWVNDPRTHVSFGAYFKTLLEAIKIRWWLWRRVYKLPNSI